MKTFVYFIEGEEENATVIRAKDWKSFAKKFCIQEEVDIFAAIEQKLQCTSYRDKRLLKAMRQHLAKYTKWKFLVIDDANIRNVHEVVIPYII